MGKIDNMLNCADVILETTKGQLVFQQRDNKPTITNPGKIGFFGGRVKDNETPSAAAIREIKEELSLYLKEKDMSLFSGYPKVRDNGLCYVYVARNINPNKLKINEGRNIVYISKDDNLDNYNLSDHARELIKEYFYGRG